MSVYFVNLGAALAEVLERACSAQPAQFAGYCANIDFWMSEFEHLVVIKNGYEQRLQAMKDAYDDHILKLGRPYNLDDVGVPFQSIVSRTSSGDRQRMIGRARRALTRFIERAVELKFIELEQYDQLIARLESA